MPKTNFDHLRCSLGRTKEGATFCYQVKKRKDKHVVQFRLPDASLIGFLGNDCRMVYDSESAFEFINGKASADEAAQACLRIMQKPVGKNPDVVYKRANKRHD